jgi:hypothetical protein
MQVKKCPPVTQLTLFHKWMKVPPGRSRKEGRKYSEERKKGGIPRMEERKPRKE